jgi:hypothetical protein
MKNLLSVFLILSALTATAQTSEPSQGDASGSVQVDDLAACIVNLNLPPNVNPHYAYDYQFRLCKAKAAGFNFTDRLLYRACVAHCMKY